MTRRQHYVKPTWICGELQLLNQSDKDVKIIFQITLDLECLSDQIFIHNISLNI